MDTNRMLLKIWLKTWISMSLVLVGTKSARPRFDISTDMGMVLVPADAEVDSVIFRLRATDQDVDFPLVFDITSTVTPVVRIENLPCTLYNKVCQANVILTRRLTAGRLHDFAVRVRDSKGDTNSMQATISVTNATTPRDTIFPHIPTLIMVPEDTKPGKDLDYISVKSNPWSGKPVYIELWQPKELFTIRQRQSPGHTRGTIILTGELDFETQSMYTLTIYATDPYTEPRKDTRNIAGLHLIVIVQDVQDVPPIFTLAPPLTKINNTVKPGDVILRVHAEDGDKGVPREITYGLVSEGNPFTPFFNITESTGEIILARPLDELTQITHVGAPIVLSVVAEEIRRSTDEPPAQATVVKVGLLLGEPGNSPPYFENENYVAWMDENAEPGTSILFEDPYSTRVRDEDIGKAGVFTLKLENNNGTFEISPTVAERTANFILTVRDNTLIDYEKYKSLRFKIVAQEVGPATNLSATVPVTIFLKDINDNPPEFQESSYEVTLSENVTTGTRVTQVHATDEDTGVFGRVQYTRIIGPGGEAFSIHPDTGVITVSMATSVLDREITPQLLLTVEACDEDGKGLRGTVPFIVNLLDANDNAPIFEKDSFEFTLNVDLTNFTAPAIIKAFDADAEPPNNIVRYEIIHGNYENKFILNETTGELFLREPIIKIRSTRHNSYQRFSTKQHKSIISTSESPSDGLLSSTQRTYDISTLLSVLHDYKINNNSSNTSNNTSEKINRIFRRKKREDKEVLFTLTARAYDLGVPHLSGTTQIKILQSPQAGVRTLMFLVPGEHLDRNKTAQTLATITGGKVTILDIRPYTPGSLPNGVEDVPGIEKKSIVVAKIEYIGTASIVDIEKIRTALAANGVGVIGGDMTVNGSTIMHNNDTLNSNKNTTVIPGNGETVIVKNKTVIINNDKTNVNKNGTITTISSEEVTVYKAENKLLLWMLIILGLLMLAAIILVIICCICPSCPFYMAPRKRRVHSSETVTRDGRPKKHVYRRRPQVETTWPDKKQAWSADQTRDNWQFNRRNIRNYGIVSLPGDVVYDDHEREFSRKAHSLRLQDTAGIINIAEARKRGHDRLFMEDVEAFKTKGYDTQVPDMDSLRQNEIERGSDMTRQAYMRDEDEKNQTIRDQHFYRAGNAEVMTLVTRGANGNITYRVPDVMVDQVHKVDGKDILLRRFMEDQSLRVDHHDYHDSMQDLEKQSMESHKRQKEVSLHQQHQQEIILIPEQLESTRQHLEEVGPDIQRLIIDHAIYDKSSRSDIKENQEPTGSTTVIIQDSMAKVDSQKESTIPQYPANMAHYTIHDIELARQNALLTRLLLERDRGAGGAVLDTGSYLETQSLPGHVTAGTQTNQTIATQTEQPNRSRSDNDESEEDARLRRKMRSKKRYDGEAKRTRALWMRSPIREEDREYSEKSVNFMRRKMKDVKDIRKSSLEPEVLKEISDSLDETGERDTPINDRVCYVDSSNSRDEIQTRDDSSSMEMRKEYTGGMRGRKVDDRNETRKKEKKVAGKDDEQEVKKPSFKLLEREINSLSKKLSKLTGKKLHSKENDFYKIKKDMRHKDIDVTSPDICHEDEKDKDRTKKIDSMRSKRLKTIQQVTKSSSSQLKMSDEVIDKHKKQEKFKYKKASLVSTASSELEEVSKSKKQAITKETESEISSKASVGKIMKAKLKRQLAIKSGQFSPIKKRKDKLVKQSKKYDADTKKQKTERSADYVKMKKETEMLEKFGGESNLKKRKEKNGKSINKHLLKEKENSSTDESHESRQKVSSEKMSITSPEVLQSPDMEMSKSTTESSQSDCNERKSAAKLKADKTSTRSQVKQIHEMIDKGSQRTLAPIEDKKSPNKLPELQDIETTVDLIDKSDGFKKTEITEISRSSATPPEVAEGKKIKEPSTLQTISKEVKNKIGAVEVRTSELIQNSIDNVKDIIDKIKDKIDDKEDDKKLQIPGSPKIAHDVITIEATDKTSEIKIDDKPMKMPESPTKPSTDIPTPNITTDTKILKLSVEKDDNSIEAEKISKKTVAQESDRQKIDEKTDEKITKTLAIPSTPTSVVLQQSPDSVDSISQLIPRMDEKAGKKFDKSPESLVTPSASISRDLNELTQMSEEQRIKTQNRDDHDKEKLKLLADVSTIQKDVDKTKEKDLRKDDDKSKAGKRDLGTNGDLDKREDEVMAKEVIKTMDRNLEIKKEIEKKEKENEVERFGNVEIDIVKETIIVVKEDDIPVFTKTEVKEDDQIHSTKTEIKTDDKIDLIKMDDKTDLIKVNIEKDVTITIKDKKIDTNEKISKNDIPKDRVVTPKLTVKEQKLFEGKLNENFGEIVDKAISEKKVKKLEKTLEPTSPVSQTSSLSPKQVVISRETSFVSSPRRTPTQKFISSPKKIQEHLDDADSKLEIHISQNRSHPSGEDIKIFIDQSQPQSIESISISDKQHESILLLDQIKDGSLSDTVDTLVDDDSDASSESSTQTAFIARPYGTPRHRRLVRIDHVPSNDEEVLAITKTEDASKTKVSEDMQLMTSATDPKIVDIVDQLIDVDKTEPKEKDSKIKIQTTEPETALQKPDSDEKAKSIEIKKFEALKSPTKTDESALVSKDHDIEASDRPAKIATTDNNRQTQEVRKKVESIDKRDKEKLDVDDSTSIADHLPSVTDLSSDEKSEIKKKLKEPKSTDAKKLKNLSQPKASTSDYINLATKTGDKPDKLLIQPEVLSEKTKFSEKKIQSKSLSKSNGMKDKKLITTSPKEQTSLPKKIPSKLPRQSKLSEPDLEQLREKTGFDKMKLRRRIDHEKITTDKSSEKLDKPLFSRKSEKSIIDKTKKKETIKDQDTDTHVDDTIRNKQKKPDDKTKLDITKLPPKCSVEVQDKEESIASEDLPHDKKVDKRLGISVSTDTKEMMPLVSAATQVDKEIRLEVEGEHRTTDETHTTSRVTEKITIVEKSNLMSREETIEKTSDEKMTQLIHSTVTVEELKDKLIQIEQTTPTSSKLISDDTEHIIGQEESLSPHQSPSKTISRDEKQQMDHDTPSSLHKSPSKIISDDERHKMPYDKSLSPHKLPKYPKEDLSDAQPRYMEWYKQNREELERKKLEKKDGEELMQPPKWLRKSTRQRWLKMSPEDRKIFELKTPEVTSLKRKRIKPLVNVESEQLKAIVRQGRKLRRAEGKNNDPSIEIFALEKDRKPLTLPPQPSAKPQKHYLTQHSEYKYERIPPPFYLHPPPVPHPTPQASPQHIDIPPESICPVELPQQMTPPHGTIIVPLPSGSRLRHQQLLEKKSVFDIAYNEAAPGQLRADSTTPPS